MLARQRLGDGRGASGSALRACWQNAAVCCALSSLRSFCASASVRCLYAFSLQLPISSLRREWDRQASSAAASKQQRRATRESCCVIPT